MASDEFSKPPLPVKGAMYIPSAEVPDDHAPPTPSELSEADDDGESSDDEPEALPVVAPAAPPLKPGRDLRAELEAECVDAWQSQGAMERHDTRACAALTMRFCVALGLVSWPACRVVLTCLRMLAECGYNFCDIEVTFGMALATVQSARSAKFMEGMSPKERLLVVMLHVYCAHALVFDEFVHFGIWHEWLFAPFCSVKNSSGALMKICALRRWRFTVQPEMLMPIVEMLRGEC